MLLDEWLDCLTLEDESTIIHQNIGNHTPTDTVFFVRRPESLFQNAFKVRPFFGVTTLMSPCEIHGFCQCFNKHITLFMWFENYFMIAQIGMIYCK